MPFYGRRLSTHGSTIWSVVMLFAAVVKRGNLEASTCVRVYCSWSWPHFCVVSAYHKIAAQLFGLLLSNAQRMRISFDLRPDRLTCAVSRVSHRSRYRAINLARSHFAPLHVGLRWRDARRHGRLDAAVPVPERRASSQSVPGGAYLAPCPPIRNIR